MKTALIAFVVLAAAGFAALPATAQETGETQFTLIAENPDFLWKNEAGQVNPELVVPAGAEITVLVKNDAEQQGVHSLQVGDQEASGLIENAGDEVTYTFTAPETGSVEYTCPFHPSTMTGTVRVAGSEPANGGGSDGGEQNESPGLGLLGALVALGLVATVLRRK